MKTRVIFKIMVVALGLVSVSAGAEAEDVMPSWPALAELELTPSETLPSDPHLEDYARLALARNKRLQGAVASWQAQLTGTGAVGVLPDPRFTWSEALEPVQTRTGPQDRILTVSQQIPWFGTLGLRREIATDQARATAAEVQQVALDVLRDVRVAYHELNYLEKAIVITTEHQALLQQWEEAARSRYETGTGAYHDLVKAQVEIGVLEDRLAGLRDRRRPLMANFNSALGRGVDTPMTLNSVSVSLIELDLPRLQERLARRNPGLVSLGHDASRQLKAGELAGKRRLPDLSLGLRYIQIGEATVPGVSDSGQDAWFASLSVNIPLWQGSYGAAQTEAKGRYLAVEHYRSDLLYRLAARLEQAAFEYREAGRQMSLYENTLLPKGRQALAAARSAYENGSVGFLNLIDSERLLLEFELAGRRAETELLLAVAHIENLIGGPLAGVPLPDAESRKD